jgi:hypothetical protein
MENFDKQDWGQGKTKKQYEFSAKAVVFSLIGIGVLFIASMLYYAFN